MNKERVAQVQLSERVIKHRLRAEILGINKIELYKKPLFYAGFTKEAIQKSADMRRGKPALNAGIPNPKIKGVLNTSADTTSYTFVRKSDGLLFTGTRYDLRDKFDLNILQLGKLFYSKPRLVSQGWSLLKEQDDNTA